MRISIHEIISKLHKAANQLIIAAVIVLCCVIAVLVTQKDATPLEKNHSFSVLKEDFLRAVRNYDIKSARRLYGYLKEKNPYSPFVEEAAPAYLADIYLFYAKKMSFNAEAQEVFLAEARKLAPKHPILLSCPGCVPEEAMPDPSPALLEKAKILSMQVSETEKLVSDETQAYMAELTLLDQTIESMEASHIHAETERLKELLNTIESLALPEPEVIVPVQEPEIALIKPEEAPVVLIEKQAEPVAEAEIADMTMPTDDACLLSYYTRSSAVSTCMDVVSEKQYGPALFVIGEEGKTPLAFTQQPITRDAFNALCDESKLCVADARKTTQHSGFNLDLSDVEDTVQNYNSFCQMSQTCEILPSTASQALLEASQLSEYANALSKKTGYGYRLMTETDVQYISQYFRSCVAKGHCDEILGTDLENFLKNSQGILLVRTMKQ